MSFDRVTSVADRFDSISGAHGDNPVIVTSGETITYSELRLRAQTMASHLDRALDLSEGARMALFMSARVDLIVDMLAAQYLCCSFFPIRPGLPKNEVLDAVTSASARACLTLEANEKGRACFRDLIIDRRISQDAAAAPETMLPNRMEDRLDAELYLIRTSGSTGVPKMVSVSHRNLIDRFLSVEEVQTYTGQDIRLFFHSPALDFSVWEIWGALHYGGTRVIPDDDTRKIPWEIVKLIKAHGITLLCQAPSYFNQIHLAIRVFGPEQTSTLRYVILGGEAVIMETVTGFLELHCKCGVRVFNMYGITEVTVHATNKELSLPLNNPHVGNIGRLLKRAKIAIVDENQQELPIGAAGEIAVSGPGVARYFPDTEVAGFRRLGPDKTWIYLSGDQGRQNSDGEFEYLRRMNPPAVPKHQHSANTTTLNENE